MELLTALNDATSKGEVSGLKAMLEIFARLVAPFAPHLGEELWHMVRPDAPEEVSVFDQSWPDFDPKALVQETITLVVQINGKLRDRMDVPADIDQDTAVESAKSREKVIPYLEGKKIRKVIFVPKRLLNLVV
jgi:leucyl-tRNA synthetase